MEAKLLIEDTSTSLIFLRLFKYLNIFKIRSTLRALRARMALRPATAARAISMSEVMMIRRSKAFQPSRM